MYDELIRNLRNESKYALPSQTEELGNLQLESDNANIPKEKTDDVIDRSLEELRP